MKKLGIIAFLLFVMLTLHNIATVPACDLLCDTTFNPVAGFAVFDYELYKRTSGLHTSQYLYSYSISDLQSGIDISCLLQETTEHTAVGPTFCNLTMDTMNSP